MKKVICFGEMLWDMFADGKVPGGAPMNVALHLLQQGIAVDLASRLGSDASGDGLAEFLSKRKLLSGLLQRDPDLPTCEVTVSLDARQQATYIIPQPVSWDNILPESPLLDAATDASALVFGSLACRGPITRATLLQLLNTTAGLRVFDVNLRAPHYSLETIELLSAKADLVKMNEEEAGLLSVGRTLGEKVTEFQRRFPVEMVCVTRGENGALFLHKGEIYEHPGFPVQVADTVGAGDAFLATLLAGLLRRERVPHVLENACRVGAYVAGCRGANPAYEESIAASLGINRAEN